MHDLTKLKGDAKVWGVDSEERYSSLGHTCAVDHCGRCEVVSDPGGGVEVQVCLQQLISQ